VPRRSPLVVIAPQPGQAVVAAFAAGAPEVVADALLPVRLLGESDQRNHVGHLVLL